MPKHTPAEEAEFRHQVLCFAFAMREDDAETWYEIERTLDPILSFGKDKLLELAAKLMEYREGMEP